MVACDVQEKNVRTEMLDGKVGRMYVPQQEVGSIATRKMKVRPPVFRVNSLAHACSKLYALLRCTSFPHC